MTRNVSLVILLSFLAACGTKKEAKGQNNNSENKSSNVDPDKPATTDSDLNKTTDNTSKKTVNTATKTDENNSTSVSTSTPDPLALCAKGMPQSTNPGLVVQVLVGSCHFETGPGSASCDEYRGVGYTTPSSLAANCAGFGGVWETTPCSKNLIAGCGSTFTSQQLFRWSEGTDPKLATSVKKVCENVQSGTLICPLN